MALAGTLPLAAYAAWYGAHHGRFALSGADGVALWARTMTFADCAVVKPPPELARLCPNGTVMDAASEYVWAPGASLNLLPGGRFAHNDAARSFALRAIAAQPSDYLREVVEDTSIAFSWTPVAHPKRVVPAVGFGHGDWPLPEQPLIDKVTREYDPDIRGLYSVRPYADVLVAYQYPAYLRGPLLGAILLVGAAGALLRRRGARPGRAARSCCPGRRRRPCSSGRSPSSTSTTATCCPRSRSPASPPPSPCGPCWYGRRRGVTVTDAARPRPPLQISFQAIYQCRSVQSLHSGCANT
nr:hypothetical protein GCM10020093_064960 [Planobispora longispora]